MDQLANSIGNRALASALLCISNAPLIPLVSVPGKYMLADCNRIRDLFQQGVIEMDRMAQQLMEGQQQPPAPHEEEGREPGAIRPVAGEALEEETAGVKQQDQEPNLDQTTHKQPEGEEQLMEQENEVRARLEGREEHNLEQEIGDRQEGQVEHRDENERIERGDVELFPEGVVNGHMDQSPQDLVSEEDSDDEEGALQIAEDDVVRGGADSNLEQDDDNDRNGNFTNNVNGRSTRHMNGHN